MCLDIGKMVYNMIMQAVRRRKVLQEQQLQEELRQKRLKKKERERLIRRKRKQEQILRMIVFVCLLILAFVLGRISGYKKYEKEQTQTAFTGILEQESWTNTEKEQENAGQTALMPFMRTYEEKYPESTPTAYSTEEIQSKIHALAQVDSDFRNIEAQIDQYSDVLLNQLCNNPNMIQFACSYNEKYGTTNGGIEDCELNGIPLFIQWDDRWGYAAYGNNVVGLSGCGPTCMSMVIVGLTKNKEATPDALADYATENGYYESGAGTKWTFMETAGIAYGIQGTWIPLQKEMLYSELEQGHPVICAMRAGDFTAEGHYIVIAGIEDGKLKINDPNSVKRSSELWEYEDIEAQIANLWAYKVEEQ